MSQADKPVFHFRNLPDLAAWCEAQARACRDAQRSALNARRASAAHQRGGQATAYLALADLLKSSMIGNTAELSALMQKRKPTKLTDWPRMTDSLAAEICDKLRGL